eukprot:1188117-Prorocentrum_minimum.AAC.1
MGLSMHELIKTKRAVGNGLQAASPLGVSGVHDEKVDVTNERKGGNYILRQNQHPSPSGTSQIVVGQNGALFPGIHQLVVTIKNIRQPTFANPTQFASKNEHPRSCIIG